MELERGDQNKLSYFMEQVVPFGLPFLLCRVGSSHQSFRKICGVLVLVSSDSLIAPPPGSLSQRTATDRECTLDGTTDGRSREASDAPGFERLCVVNGPSFCNQVLSFDETATPRRGATG